MYFLQLSRLRSFVDVCRRRNRGGHLCRLCFCGRKTLISEWGESRKGEREREVEEERVKGREEETRGRKGGRWREREREKRKRVGGGVCGGGGKRTYDAFYGTHSFTAHAGETYHVKTEGQRMRKGVWKGSNTSRVEGFKYISCGRFEIHLVTVRPAAHTRVECY